MRAPSTNPYEAEPTLIDSIRRRPPTLRFTLRVAAISLLYAVPLSAQAAPSPDAVRAFLTDIGPRWGASLEANIAETLRTYEALLKTRPHTGVTVTRNLSYGPSPRHQLDLFRRPDADGAPIVVFVHGGAYVSGERDVNAELYGNVARYFALHGMVAVNATYRLAPAAQWPAGAEDVRALVHWLRENRAIHGGDPARIFLVGHSAGATHVATYAFLRTLQPPEGPQIAGIVLLSGRYRIEARPDDPRARNVQAYFGTDTTQYPARSPLNYVAQAPPIPVFIVIAEYDNPGLDTQGALLLAALCQRDGRCPRFTRLPLHNHISMVGHFNTGDDALGREILDFLQGRAPR